MAQSMGYDEVGVTQLKELFPLSLGTAAPWSICPGDGGGV